MTKGLSSRQIWIWVSSCLLTTALVVTLLLHLRAQQRVRSLPKSSTFSNPNAWVSFGGDWEANAMEIQDSSQQRGAKLMSRAGLWADYQVQADLEIAEPNGEAGLIIRSEGEEEGVDAYHGYFAGIRTMNSSFELGRADFGWHSLVHRSLPENANLQGPMHLRLVAVGCRFGVSITLPDGRATASVVDDPNCIPAGRFGLRSYLTSATWKNLSVSPASVEDLAALDKIAAVSATPDLAPSEPFAPPALNQYAVAILAEAKKHQLRPDVQPIISFLMAPGRHPNVAIQGTITSTQPLTDIQDDTSALIIPNLDPKISIKVGDVVEAEGTVISDRFRSRLEDAKIRVLWSDTEIPPLAVTAAQLTSGTYRGRSVEVEGILQSAVVRPDGYDLILQDGGLFFKGIGSKNFELQPNRLEIGSRLRLRGMATSLSEFTGGQYPLAVITNRVEVISPPPWWSPRHITLLAGLCACVLILAQLLLHQLQKWQMRSALQERERLAFEMHDTLAQSFTGIAYQLQAASTETRGETMMHLHIRNALDMVHISHREASRTIAALRPQYRDAAGILTALKEAAERMSDGGGLTIQTVLNGKPAGLPLEVTDVFVRVGQEALSNAIQHSNCSTLTITLTRSKREAQLVIRDDGEGFLEQSRNAGLGIDSMRTRAAKIKARFRLDTEPGEGTTITLSAPLTFARGWLPRFRAKILGSSLS